MNNEKDGVMYAIFSYILWGLTPLYWKVVQYVSPGEILAQRVIWSYIFILFLIIITKKWRNYINFTKQLMRNLKLLSLLVIASLLISSNWGIFMWAVINGKMLEASLGQYINPLTSMIIGVIALKERLTVSQTISFILAGLGVLSLSLAYGVFPWISLCLALTFGFYGLLKKKIRTDSTVSLALETMVITPIALSYIIYLIIGNRLQFIESIPNSLLLIGTGVVTALPLLLFTKSAQKVTLSLLGILQYISPTIALITGFFSITKR
ncbi:EamA family transporter RarD [Paenibacillus sp. FSL R5-0517]|uniref:EamA family transporter RarD n=1 Tax=Paenibacillus sp. FSL R5-0517 TaxID=2921647 RepID=UPI0030D9BE47